MSEEAYHSSISCSHSELLFRESAALHLVLNVALPRAQTSELLFHALCFCYAARVWRKPNNAVLKLEKTAPKFAHSISSLFRKPPCWSKCRKVSRTPRLAKGLHHSRILMILRQRRSHALAPVNFFSSCFSTAFSVRILAPSPPKGGP